MPVVPREVRLARLRELGVGEQLVEVAAGTRTHPLLWYRCLAPPELCYLGGASTPSGPEFIPLWESHDSVTGVRSSSDGREFLRFDVEDPEQPDILAKTEQGLWATLIVDLYEDNDTAGRDDFRPLADLIGFAHLDRLLDLYEAADHKTHTSHQAFVKVVVAELDAL